MRRPAKTIGAPVDAAAVTIYRVIECHIGALICADNRTRFGFLKDFDLRGGRLANPFNRMSQPGIRRIFDETHICNPVLSMKHSIANPITFGEVYRLSEARP